MKLIHHVKKHGKTITLHLKKHHKKYIFGILSATLLRKGVSLIAAYALVHNLSFSFADIVHQGEGGDEGIIVEETINDEENKTTSTIEPQETTNNGNEEEPGNKIEDETITTTETSNIFESNISTTIEGEDQTEGNNLMEKGEDQTEGDSSTRIEGITELDNSNTPTNPDTPTEPDTPTNPNTLTEPDTPTNSDTPTEPEDNTTTNETSNENGKCDRGDIEIISPIGGDIVGGTFDISREFKNDDCSNTEYAIKLRTESGQLEIFSGNSENTGFSFDSTQLESDYYTKHNLMIYGNDTIYREEEGGNETIYRNEEGGDFTIDNKAPELSNTGIQYSTRNKKLNIGDTVTVSFESDEELTGVTVNIQGTRAYLDEKDGNKYKYTMEFTENNNTGKIVYGIDYSDIAGNTGYYERYDNIELDYTAPKMENINMTKSGNEIRVIFDTDEITNAYLVYMISGARYTNSLENNNKTGHEFILNDIRNKLKYNYSIAIEDEAKNKLNIGGDFYLSGDKVIFTNKEIRAGDLITEAGFKTGDEQDLKERLNGFDKCSENIKFINMNLPIDGLNGKLAMPSYANSSVNQMTNAFTTLLVKRIEGKAFSQRDLDEIFEDLNNFLIVVKLVKDDENVCKQNMSQYYINRFKKTLIKYKLINN